MKADLKSQKLEVGGMINELNAKGRDLSQRRHALMLALLTDTYYEIFRLWEHTSSDSSTIYTTFTNC